MREAGWNLILYYSLLPDSEVDRLRTMTKRSRTIEIGKLRGKDKILSAELSNAFMLMRKKLFKENGLVDADIISIKKDAICVMDKKCNHTKFGNVEFVAKHKYTSFHKFGNIEMYYNGNDNKLDIKGISDNLLGTHKDYMINILCHIFSLLEDGDKKKLISFLKELIYLYKNRKLDMGYYRELNQTSTFTFNQNMNASNYYVYGFNQVEKENKDNININFNYIKYIHPIIQRHYYIDI